jgi:hypothetical protein
MDDLYGHETFSPCIVVPFKLTIMVNDVSTITLLVSKCLTYLLVAL